MHLLIVLVVYLTLLAALPHHTTNAASTKKKRQNHIEFLPMHGEMFSDFIIPTVGFFSNDSSYPPFFDPSSPFIDFEDIRPVFELQDEQAPIRSFGAVIPRVPPPAIPVSTLGTNIPPSAAAIYLGSGSLGIVHLGNGAYAIGSGSLGYSMNRAQPRPSIDSPVFPPLPASPDLLPAAVPTFPVSADELDLNLPPLPADLQSSAHRRYEFLTPERVRFGSPTNRLPQLKIRQQFATAERATTPQQQIRAGGSLSQTAQRAAIVTQYYFSAI